MTVPDAFQNAFAYGELNPDTVVTSGDTTYQYDANTGELTETTTNPNGSSTTTGYLPTDAAYTNQYSVYLGAVAANDVKPPQAVNSLSLHHSTATPTPPTQPGGSGAQPPKPPTKPTAPSPGEPPGGSGRSHRERPSYHPDAQSAFDYAMEQIGVLLDDTNANATFAKSLGGDNAVAGLQNGYEDDISSWRLDWDPQKGLHFNWMLGKKIDDMYGAAMFPGTYDTYQNMLLGLAEGGIEMMLALWGP